MLFSTKTGSEKAKVHDDFPAAARAGLLHILNKAIYGRFVPGWDSHFAVVLTRMSTASAGDSAHRICERLNQGANPRIAGHGRNNGYCVSRCETRNESPHPLPDNYMDGSVEQGKRQYARSKPTVRFRQTLVPYQGCPRTKLDVLSRLSGQF